MDFMQLAAKRCSVRKFQSKAVEEDKVKTILEAGRIAPTAANRQPQRVLVVKTEEGLEKLKRGANVYGAPLALVICADHSVSWKRPLDNKDTADIDATIVTTHMMLEATALGLHSIWVCYFKPDLIRSEFAIPDHFEPLNILGVGYPDGEVKSPDRHATDRKPLNEMVTYERF